MDIFWDAMQLGVILLALGILIWAALIIRRHFSKTSYPTRMAEMMRRIGIETKDLEALQYETHLPTAARLCDACSSKGQCDAWLAVQSGSTPPAFCPNAQFFTLVANQGAHTD